MEQPEVIQDSEVVEQTQAPASESGDMHDQISPEALLDDEQQADDEIEDAMSAAEDADFETREWADEVERLS